MVALWLSIKSIRKSLVPINLLKEGANRIVQRDFNQQVIVSSGDEFEELADAFNEMSDKPYWDNHFWTEGYCVDTVGLDSEMIRKYVKYQENQERRAEQQGKLF